jgi:hypothetical protein
MNGSAALLGVVSDECARGYSLSVRVVASIAALTRFSSRRQWLA